MKLELQSASNFLVHLIRLSQSNISEYQLTKFQNHLIKQFWCRYKDHWFPETPFKSSSYRCIRINEKMDPLLIQAGEACGFSAKFLYDTFPEKLTLWINPLEVSYLLGENGNICVLYEYNEKNCKPWIPILTKQPKHIFVNYFACIKKISLKSKHYLTKFYTYLKKRK